MMPSLNFKSQVILRNQWPELPGDREQYFLLYDRTFVDLVKDDPQAQDFLKQFPYQLGVKAGEGIKSFKDFPKNLELILKKWPLPVKRNQTLVVMGGGSLGDFAGFVASILHRGIGLIQIPTTWIAAMDSVHGGKTALNFAGVKNQLGTFYPAQKIYVIKDILESNPPELKQQSYGELIKMSLIGSSGFFKEIVDEKRTPEEFMWRFLKNCIEDKYDVVLQDPYETQKIRQILNFGHTLGHGFESYFKWSHGESVLQGLFFALEWSRYRGDLSQSRFEEIMTIISKKFDRTPAHQLSWYRKASAKSMSELVCQDKKTVASGEINFVFLKNIAKPVVKAVRVEDLISEAKRQGWLK